jgi:ankyrin repeat protein
MENFQSQIQKQFFEYINSDNRAEIVRYFREIEYKPWEFLDEDGNTGKFPHNSAILRSTYLDLTLLTVTMIDEIKLRIGPDSQEVLKTWVNLESKEGNTPFLYACFRGNIDLIQNLIENSANHLHTNNQGLNCLHVAAQGNKPESLLFMVEKYGLDINSRDSVNSTPLHWACYTGSQDVVNYILALNPQIDIQDKEGFSALHLAVISGSNFS